MLPLGVYFHLMVDVGFWDLSQLTLISELIRKAKSHLACNAPDGTLIFKIN